MSQKSTASKGSAKSSSSKGGGSKSKGNFLSRQAKGAKKKAVTEADLLSKGAGKITPEDVLALEEATQSESVEHNQNLV